MAPLQLLVAAAANLLSASIKNDLNLPRKNNIKHSQCRQLPTEIHVYSVNKINCQNV